LKKASLLCCTWGEKGAVVAGPKDGFVHEARLKNPPGFVVVDPVGAGDTWTAGMMYGFLSGQGSLSDRAKEAAQFANRLAGKKVSQEGFKGLTRELET